MKLVKTITNLLLFTQHIDNYVQITLIMVTKIIIKGKSRYNDCMANKSFFDRIKHKGELKITVPQFLTD